jgi:hypothetical protein
MIKGRADKYRQWSMELEVYRKVMASPEEDYGDTTLMELFTKWQVALYAATVLIGAQTTRHVCFRGHSLFSFLLGLTF